MQEYKGTFNIYCDESCHLIHDHMPYMVIGYIKIPYNKLKTVKGELKALKESHNVSKEIKWCTVSNSREEFYLGLLDYLFSTDDIEYRAIVVKKGQYDKEFQDLNRYDILVMSKYVRLVYHNLDLSYKYNLYFDKIDDIKSYRINRTRKSLKKMDGAIRTFQIMHSYESIFMQISDLLTGAISYGLRELQMRDKASPIKTKIIEKINFLFDNPIEKVKLQLKIDYEYCLLELSKNAIKSPKKI